jgi:hypothetical protein
MLASPRLIITAPRSSSSACNASLPIDTPTRYLGVAGRAPPIGQGLPARKSGDGGARISDSFDSPCQARAAGLPGSVHRGRARVRRPRTSAGAGNRHAQRGRPIGRNRRDGRSWRPRPAVACPGCPTAARLQARGGARLV